MTISPGNPGPTDPASGGRALPPYEGRRETADVDSAEEMRRDGANVAGATGPVESDEQKAPDPATTPRGSVASPSDEQPAEEPGQGESEEASVGPAHYAGTGRAENKSAGDSDFDEGGAQTSSDDG
jgi:hypothetical protein